MRPANRFAAASIFILAASSWPLAESISADLISTCSGRLFDRECKDHSKDPLDLRKSTSEADGTLFNYALLTQRDKYETIMAFNTMPGKDLQTRALKIAEEARAAAIRYVTGGLDEENWSTEVRVVAQRLRLVKFRIADSTSSECIATGDPGIPNAQYTPQIHAIAICPATLKIPSAEIASTLAHELGHSVSPCTLEKPLLKILKTDSDYGVEQDPEWTKTLVAEKNVEVLPGGSIADPPAYRSIRACLDSRYKEDYDGWLASKLQLERLPKKLSPRFQSIVDRERLLTPQRCYPRFEEHFADSFGAFTYDAWSTAREIPAKETKTGLHFMTNMKCAHDLNPDHVAFKNNHANDSVRLGLFLKPKGTAARIGCAPSEENLCSLSESSFASERIRPETNGSAEGTGTKP